MRSSFTYFHAAECVILKLTLLPEGPNGQETVTSATATLSLQLPAFSSSMSLPDPGPRLMYPELTGGFVHCLAVVPGRTCLKQLAWLTFE
jgi:hypothetical protein